MKLWLISQKVNDDYDTFDSAVVAAETEDDARLITPDGLPWEFPSGSPWDVAGATWAKKPDQVTVRYIGEAAPDVERGVVLTSFNAG